MDHLVDLISKMLKDDPKERIKAKEILEHPFCKIWKIYDRFKKE